jgi:hypothetical protein
MTLAILAVAVRVAVPAGFMIAPPSNDLPFPIVLCTGNGMVSVEPGGALSGHEGKDKAPGQDAHDNPCVFTGHGVAAAPPTVAEAPAPVFVDYAPQLPATASGLIPGRGLTGPPLPARGPPERLI